MECSLYRSGRLKRENVSLSIAEIANERERRLTNSSQLPMGNILNTPIMRMLVPGTKS